MTLFVRVCLEIRINEKKYIITNQSLAQIFLIHFQLHNYMRLTTVSVDMNDY